MRAMTRREVVRVLGVGVFTVACGRTAAVPRPEDVVLGRDECAWCRMLIDDPRLPAEFVRRGARVEKFGEPGCLLAWLDENESAEGVSFVTVENGVWMPASQAHFMVGAQRTPMSFDITAHRAPPAGDNATWSQLLQKGAPSVRAS